LPLPKLQTICSISFFIEDKTSAIKQNGFLLNKLRQQKNYPQGGPTWKTHKIIHVVLQRKAKKFTKTYDTHTTCALIEPILTIWRVVFLEVA